MKRSVKRFSPEFKLKVVLESIREELTTNQIAAKYNTIPRNIQCWRKHFLQNAEIAFNKDKGIKEYKEKLKEKDIELEEAYKELGRLTAQLIWAKKKAEEAGYSS